MWRYRLELIIFVSGAVTMILEIVASRALAPFVGTSLPVWTSIIGAVLGFLSIGYAFGGRLADRGAQLSILAQILLAASALVTLTTFCYQRLLTGIGGVDLPVGAAALIAATVLLGPASAVLGMVFPYATRLSISEVQSSGRVIGSLGALSTIGSIFGTFFAGFFLLEYVGTHGILILLALTLALLSAFASVPRGRILVLTGIIAVMIASLFFYRQAFAYGLTDIDTAYSRVWVGDAHGVRTLYIGGTTNSAASLTDPDDLVFPYTRYYRLARHFNPNLNATLMIGGGGYIYPQYFLRHESKASMDVIEIDSAITQVARDYFGLTHDPRLTIFHEDARTFLNKNTKKYDAVYGDSFSSYYSVPYQLTTREAMQKIADSLTEDGVFIMNLASAFEGDKSRFFQAEYRTIASVFPQVLTFAANGKKATTVQNIVIVGLNSSRPASLTSANAEFQELLDSYWTNPIIAELPVLTDDLAPVDQYIGDLAL